MLDPIFAKALIRQGSHRVLGRTVRPFSLWHTLLLQAIDSPLLYRDRLVTAVDLDRAASICRCRFGRVDFSARHPLRLILQTAVGGGLIRQHQAFADYVADYSAQPRYNVVPTKAQLESAPPLPRGRPPEVVATVTAIIGWSHWEREKVWELPPSEARIYAGAAQEASGAALDYEDEEQRRFQAELEALESAGQS